MHHGRMVNVLIPNVGYNAKAGNATPLYGGTYYPPGITKSTGATAGAPGSWTPGGSQPPANEVQAIAWGVTASPTADWTVGQYVQGGDPGATGKMNWNATTWVEGASP